jgi:hypothetical protein
LYNNDLKLKNNQISGSPSYGFYLQSCNDELEVTGNKASGYSTALYLNNCVGGTGQEKARALVSNNFVFTGTGGNHSLYSYNNTNIDFYHNSTNNLSNNASSSSFHVYAGSGLNVVNNIFLHKGQGYPYYVQTTSAVSTSDHNDLYGYGTYVGNWGGTQIETLSDFQQASGKEANSVSTNPGFLSDYDMYAVSAILDSAGTPLARVLHDIEGESRNALYPDIGADEFDSTAVVSIDDDLLAGSSIPNEFRVHNNYPNPFNPETTIRYDLPSAVHVRLEVYNILGQLVTRLVDTEQNAGMHIYRFNAGNLASGTYFYRLEAGEHTVVRRMILKK